MFKKFIEGFKTGDIKTRLSYVFFGAGSFLRKQYVRGFTFLSLQIIGIIYLINSGFSRIKGLATLGTVVQGKTFDEERGIYVYTQGDNSMLFLLFGVLAVLIIIGLVFLYYLNIKNAIHNQKLVEEGKPLPTFKEDVQDLLDSRFHITVLSLPTILTLMFTVLPLIFMILIAFTNFDQNHQPPGNLFTWVGLDNFKVMFYDSKIISGTFFALLRWTFTWAFFATFLNYFLGMLLAILINSKGVKLKKFWRTVFVITIAIPQFVSLLLMSKLLADQGTINQVLMNMGKNPIPFLSNGNVAKITVIIVNLWVGVPYTMLITSGILMNIPQDMYESAKIDGAGPWIQFVKITLPYMLHVTAPYLITQFVGNINNFNVIYLLTGGGPLTLKYYQAGHTDLLVTWLYKLTVNDKNYAMASTLGIIIFVISATLSLVVFRKVTEEGKEGAFQ
ncbi:MAG: sugar ABC transporter permease [Erysipelothrix sp.]|nr:sugar ABC transporter permease [Erysipelothrix sp.]